MKLNINTNIEIYTLRNPAAVNSNPYREYLAIDECGNLWIASDGNGCANPIQIDEDNVRHIGRKKLERMIESATQAGWSEAAEWIERFSKSDGKPTTLAELTGHESGMVVYPDGDAIICNWMQLGEGVLPRVFMGGIVGLGNVDFSESEEIEVTEATLDDIMAFVYVENEGDDECMAHDMKNGECLAWELPDGTKIIASNNWD